MRKVTTKGLHIDVKRGLTVEQLLKKYDLATEEELFDVIRRLTPRNAADFMKSLKANGKKATKVHRFMVEAEPQKVEEVTTEPFELSEPVFSVETAVKETIELSLEQLQDDESQLSQWCIDLEIKHKAMAQRRRAIVEELSKVKRALMELKELLKVNDAKTHELLEEYNELAVQLSTSFAEITSCKEMLEEVRHQLEEAKKLHILVFSEGIIESTNGEALLSPPEKEVDSLVSTLVQRPDAEELTLRGIKMVAKAIVLIQHLNQKCEVEFDSEQLQKFFDTVVLRLA